MSEKKIEIKVLSETRDYDGYLKIDKAVISETSEDGTSITYDRFKLVRPDAVAVILYNSDEDEVVLVRQHRYPTTGKVNSNIYEIIAGKIDDGEEPIDSAIREVEEEVGYKLDKDNFLYRGAFFASPGYSTEMLHLFVASATNENRVSDGGGLESENENIEVLHILAGEFFDMFGSGEIVDAKSVIGANALWHLRNENRVKIGLEYYNKLASDRTVAEEEEDKTQSENKTDIDESKED